jgi:hypothetical protein
MSGRPRNAVAAMLLSTCPLIAAAEIVDAGDAGFTTRHSIAVAAPRADVYRTAVGDIGSWWSGDHTVSGDAANLYIDARPQGCFCERLGQGAGVVHMTVTFVNPGVLLRLSGGLGPLGLMGVSGNLTWEFAQGEEGTLLTWTYAVGGYLPVGPEEMAVAVDEVLMDQMRRLKARAETASSAGPAEE